MGDKITLTLKQRTEQGKKVAKLRQEGLVPGIIYGQGFEPIMVQSEHNVLEKVVREAGKHTPVYTVIDGKKKIAMIKDIDRDPVKAKLRHVSFHAVKANEAVTAEVPIHLVGEGESPAEKAGLVVLQAIESVEVKALPANLPSSLEVSIAKLETTEDDVTLADITLPENVEFADLEQDMSLVVANVYEPSALQAANEAAGGDAEDVDDVEAENGGETEESDVPATGESDNE